MKKLNGQEFLYDKVSRLKSGSVLVGGVPKTQSLSYDGWGNVTSIVNNGVTRNIPTDATTNRVSTASYDAAGSMTGWNGASYGYDRLNMMKQMCSAGTLTTCTGENWLFAYTADDERILSYRPAGGAFHTALRDLDGKILREYKTELGGWPAFEDYIYRGRTPLASIHPTEGTRYFGTDHLGTPRFVFSAAGPTLLATHTYYPLGEEATSVSQDTQQLKFTGHERDMLNTPTATADDTDNMHARQFSLQLGRFMSTDPVRGDPHQPQSFNLYSYVIGNPLKYVDPFGLKKTDETVDSFAKDPCSAPIEWECLRQPEQPINTDIGEREKRKEGRDRRLGENVDDSNNPWRGKPCTQLTYGFSLELSSINPFTSGNGGGSSGVSVQFTAGGIALYRYSTPGDQASEGFSPGASLSFNVALGSGRLEGATRSVNAGAGRFAGGLFYSGGGPAMFGRESGTGYVGAQFGYSAGPPGLSSTRTQSTFIGGIGPDHGCF